jgi:hypothetical protein
LLVLLGVGAVLPFVGPYFDYGYTPDNAWDYTTGRLVLEVMPGVGPAVGGLLVLSSAGWCDGGSSRLTATDARTTLRVAPAERGR